MRLFGKVACGGGRNVATPRFSTLRTLARMAKALSVKNVNASPVPRINKQSALFANFIMRTYNKPIPNKDTCYFCGESNDTRIDPWNLKANAHINS
jgi:hypothetical protein